MRFSVILSKALVLCKRGFGEALGIRRRDGSPKLIREWLGHSGIRTTMNICAHLDTTAKDVSAAAMSQALSLPDWSGGYGWQRN